ncbi:MAG: peptide chain release factor-like protein [Candidatus Omnitrophota bacterium]
MNIKGLKIEYYKSGGPGGQHKNKRNMAVRVTHLATGLTAVGQEYRTQSQNKEAALERLKARLKEKYRRKKIRIATRQPRAVKECVLKWKKKRGIKKRSRREKITADE